MVEQKEVEEFLIRLGGALTGCLEDTAFEGYWKLNPELTRDTFPYILVHEKLPPGDDLIVGGLSIPPWVIGALIEGDAKKRLDPVMAGVGGRVKMFGEGNVCYSIGMVLHHTLVRCTDPKAWPPAAQVSGKPPASGSGRTLYV